MHIGMCIPTVQQATLHQRRNYEVRLMMPEKGCVSCLITSAKDLNKAHWESYLALHATVCRAALLLSLLLQYSQGLLQWHPLPLKNMVAYL